MLENEKGAFRCHKFIKILVFVNGHLFLDFKSLFILPTLQVAAPIFEHFQQFAMSKTELHMRREFASVLFLFDLVCDLRNKSGFELCKVSP